MAVTQLPANLRDNLVIKVPEADWPRAIRAPKPALALLDEGHSRELTTAAMDGTSECPGDPWETSIPKIIVGTLDTRGIAGMFQFGATNSCHPAV